jgi:tetratricopeptide (TPR) repeat protein
MWLIGFPLIRKKLVGRMALGGTRFVGRFAAVVLLAWPFYLCSLLGQEPGLDRARSLLQQGQAKDALAILLEVYRSKPSNPDVCQQIGIAYTQLQDFPQAEKFYRDAVRMNPQFWAARKNLATVLWFMDRHDESEREFRAVSEGRPNDPVPHLYLGLAAVGRKEFPGAKLEFQRAGTLASENPEVLPAVIESYLATRDVSLPQKIEEQITNSRRLEPSLAYRVGALFLQYGYSDRAASVLEAFTSAHGDSSEGWRTLAQAYDQQNRPTEAYRAYARAVETDSNSEDNYVAFADFASAHGNNDYALDVVAKGLQQLPHSAPLLCERGLLLALKGDRGQAESCFMEARKFKPDWGLPLLALGILQLESGDAKSAAATFQKARIVSPEDFRTHYLYAMALSKENIGHSDAIAALRKAIQVNSQDARPHALLGQLLLAEHPGEAATEWQQALKVDAENPTALYQLALLYRKQGKAAQADQLFETFQRVKATMRTNEQSLVQILKVVPEKQTR